ncbi:MAG: PaaI family thioesterase [Candidatus Eisenbacteria bacterium]
MPASPVDLQDDGGCFVCGRENPLGLRLSWSFEEDRSRARFRPSPHHQGWRGIVHGGILAALLDEAMAQRLRFSAIRGVTATMTIRYRAPVPTSTEIVVEGFLEADRGRALRTRAEARTPDGKLVADAEGTCIRSREG